MVGIGKSDQVTGKSPVELCPARPTAPQSRIDGSGDPIVLTTKSTVSLQVTLLEQRLEHDRLGVQLVAPPSASEEMRLSRPGDKARSYELQKLETG